MGIPKNEIWFVSSLYRKNEMDWTFLFMKRKYSLNNDVFLDLMYLQKMLFVATAARISSIEFKHASEEACQFI